MKCITATISQKLHANTGVTVAALLCQANVHTTEVKPHDATAIVTQCVAEFVNAKLAIMTYVTKVATKLSLAQEPFDVHQRLQPCPRDKKKDACHAKLLQVFLSRPCTHEFKRNDASLNLTKLETTLTHNRL